MTEHILLLQREIKQLEINLERAKIRPGVKQEEIQNLENKIQLKKDILHVVEKQIPEKQNEKHTYGVFWKMKSSEYEPQPKWIKFNAWYKTPEEAEADLKKVRQNTRCASARVVVRREIFEDYEGL